MQRHYPLHIHISTLFVVLILLIAGIVAGLSYTLSRDMLETMARDLTRRISREKLGELQRVVVPAEMAVNLLALDGVATARNLMERRRRLPFFVEALKNSQALSSLYVGYGNGDFLLVRRLHSAAEEGLFRAPPGTRYILQSIERQGQPGRGRFAYLDENLNTLREDERPDYAASFDPRQRGWYRDALAASGQIKTPPYLFFSDRQVGMTLATRTPTAGVAVGADIRLETLSADLGRQKVTPNTHMVLVNPAGQVIAREAAARPQPQPTAPDGSPGLPRLDQIGIPVLASLGNPADLVRGNAPFDGQRMLGQEEWRVSVHPLRLDGAQPLFLVIAIPERELLAAAIEQRKASLLASALIILLSIPLTWGAARAVSGTLRTLAGEAEAIRRFDFDRPFEVSSAIREVHELARTVGAMKRTIHHFLDITRAVAGEENFSRLLPMLLTETLSAAEAEAGILYLTDHGRLVPAAALLADGTDRLARLDSVDEALAGPLLGAALADGKTATAALSDEDVHSLGLDGLLPDTAGRQGVALALTNRQHQRVGALFLVRSTPIGAAQASFIEALSGSAASSLEARELIQAQKDLFHAFIRVIATAIDAKSPYTGAHCARVPELTRMLARAAAEETSGPFRDFRLDEAGWETLHVAAWLHDCGKVTMPEYVVDKATKLSTLYDRLHEIRMRFEVLKRDAEIACLRSIAAGEDETAARARLADEWRQLDEDFTFVAACNEGTEAMAPEDRVRLERIARHTWRRTLDDRIGLSHEEQQRKARSPAPALPAEESLLADKPEHLLERRPQDRLAPDNPWGFRMDEPELLYNQGELYNLSIGHGTLTGEERYRIDGHIVQTLIMLSELPFPKHLRNVPEIAGGHHERMDGKGYPKRLRKEEMSLQARMIAIADIFEALTAADRPYKRGKSPAEAVGIMVGMSRSGHIDPDLFELFLRADVPGQYAERFLRAQAVSDTGTAPPG